MGRGRGPNTADSYIGSLISLTSKSEIRYEGILYTVDTENSNIALQNVRSFGTEGRKKDGPQIPASDKVYDYIIFRGSDIKDLQVKSSPPPPPLQPPPPPSQPTDPAIISLQSQPLQYPPPSSLGSYNAGAPAAGSSSEPSAPPPPYMGMPPSQFRGPVPPLYTPAGMQSWGPPPPPLGANGPGMGMPMYWQGYYRPPPAGHMQPHQPMPPQPPPSLAAPAAQGGQQQQGPQAPSLPGQFPAPAPAVSRPPGPVSGPSSSGVAGLASQFQAATSSSIPAASTASSAAPVAPLMPATTAPASSTVTSAVPTQSIAANPVATSIGTPVSGSALGVPVSGVTSLPLSMSGVSAVITPMRGDPRRGVGIVSQAPPVVSVQGGGVSSQGLLTPSMPSVVGVSSGGLIQPPGEMPQSSVAAGTKTKSGAAEQVAVKVEQKAVEPVSTARPGVVQASSQGGPAQEKSNHPLLPLPSAEQTQQGTAQRGSHGVPVGQRNRWQGNGYMGNGQYNRRGRGRGGGRGRGVGLANPTQIFTEDFDFTAMNEKFNKDEVWGTLGGKGEEEEVYEYDDGHVEDEDTQIEESDASKKVLYNKDDFFDSLSCDTLYREGGRGERTKFSEQRKIDTETFGAFPVRSRGGRGFRGGRRGGYRGGYYGGGGGSYGIGRGGGGGGYGRGRGMGRPSSAIV